MRLKALVEIYTTHSFATFAKLIFSLKIAEFFAEFCRNIAKLFARILLNFAKFLPKIFWIFPKCSNFPKPSGGTRVRYQFRRTLHAPRCPHFSARSSARPVARPLSAPTSARGGGSLPAPPPPEATQDPRPGRHRVSASAGAASYRAAVARRASVSSTSVNPVPHGVHHLKPILLHS